MKNRRYTRKNIDDMAKTTLENMQALIARGVKPWIKPWTSDGIVSYATGKSYSPLNEFFIQVEKFLRGIELAAHDEFCTYFQLMEEGETALAAVKGKKGYTIFKPKPCHYFRPTGELDDNGEEVMKEYSFMRYTPERVFSRAELGLKNRHPEAPKFAHNPIEEAEAIISAYVTRAGIEFVRSAGSNSAYSEHDGLRVVVPSMERFKSLAAYYSTIFHELTHSTASHGAPRECHEKYSQTKNWRAQEELVAELGAATLCALCGLEKAEEEQSAAYLAGWSQRLTVDHARAFMAAMQQARAAVRIILGKAEDEATTEPASPETAQAPEPTPEPAEKKRVKREPVAAVPAEPAGDLFGWARIA